MFSLPSLSRSRRDAIESRIDDLRDEIAELSREASHLGHDAYESVRHSAPKLWSDLEQTSRAIAPMARRQARVAERTVRDHPTAAVATAGLLLLGLAATILYSRK